MGSFQRLCGVIAAIGVIAAVIGGWSSPPQRWIACIALTAISTLLFWLPAESVARNSIRATGDSGAPLIKLTAHGKNSRVIHAFLSGGRSTA